MYESHFGLSGPPFQLSPDPSFYFESKGHANALSYLKFGVFQGEGFIVVTGEIGAGKTMLVRTLLEMLNRDQVVAAQIVSTQLEADDLLRAITVAFGIPVTGLSKSQLIGSLEAFFTSLAAKQRHALLVIDEAQNLSAAAIEELRMLSNFQLGNKALLQSFFVGQPELRKMLQLPSMEQFRQRVIASCHLGPMDRQETQAYIEHRLRKAGWKGVPSFDAEAFTEIHRATDGIPRRINLLCNRVLLGCYLAGGEQITAALVKEVSAEFRAEVWQQGQDRMPALERPYVVAEKVGSASNAQAVPAPHADSVGEAARSSVRDVLVDAVGPLLVLVDSPMSRVKAAVMARAFLSHSKLPPALVINLAPVQVGAAAEDERTSALGNPPLEVRLEAVGGAFAAAAAETMVKFDAILEDTQPAAVIAAGNGDALLACGLVAAKRGVNIIRVDAGDRSLEAPASERFNAELLDRLANVLYTSRLTAHYMLYRLGIGSERIVNVGSLMQDLLAEVLPSAVAPEITLSEFGLPTGPLRNSKGYAVAALNVGPASAPSPSLNAVLPVLCAVANEIPLVCIVNREGRRALEEGIARVRMNVACPILVTSPNYLGMLGLLGQAQLVVMDTRRSLHEEAATLGVPIITVGEPSLAGTDESSVIGFVGLDVGRAAKAVAKIIEEGLQRRDGIMALPELEASNRIAVHLGRWLTKSRMSSSRMDAETAR